jgi:hypothetical protein
MTFKFNLGDAVQIEDAHSGDIASNGDKGIILGRAEWNFQGNSYWVSFGSPSDGGEVHRNAAAQLRGESQYLDCTHGLPFDESWERFKLSMLVHHLVVVDEKWRPSP